MRRNPADEGPASGQQRGLGPAIVRPHPAYAIVQAVGLGEIESFDVVGFEVKAASRFRRGEGLGQREFRQRILQVGPCRHFAALPLPMGVEPVEHFGHARAQVPAAGDDGRVDGFELHVRPVLNLDARQVEADGRRAVGELPEFRAGGVHEQGQPFTDIPKDQGTRLRPAVGIHRGKYTQRRHRVAGAACPVPVGLEAGEWIHRYQAPLPGDFDSVICRFSSATSRCTSESRKIRSGNWSEMRHNR